jgi:hypothetical protein
MQPTGDAVIAIRRPAEIGWGRMAAHIDGIRAGDVGRGSAAFKVKPGEHSVAVSMAWYRSEPIVVTTRPNSTMELTVGWRSNAFLFGWKSILPCMLAAIGAALFMDLFRAYVVTLDTNLLLRLPVFIAIYLLIFAAYVRIAKFFSRSYWMLLTLEPVNESPASAPVTELGGPV